MVRVLLLSLSVGLLAGCAGPHTVVPTPVITKARSTPDATSPAVPACREVDLVVRDAPTEDALAQLSRQTGVNLVARGPLPRVTLVLRGVAWRDALALLLERTGCEVERVGPESLLVTRAPRVTLRGCF